MAATRGRRAGRKRPAPRKTVQVHGHKQVVGSLKATRIMARHKDHHHGGSGGGGDESGGGSAGSDLARRLREAAGIIADQARVNAGWSRKIPPSIKVSGGGAGVSISTNAGPAYPHEIPGVRHPTFGHKPWTNQHRPFLAPAGDEKADAAAGKFAEVIDDWAKENGFK